MTIPPPSETRRSYIPHSVAILFFILLLAAGLSHVVPAGRYERVEAEGRTMVVPGSFHRVEATPVGPFEMFRALPRGFREAVDIVFVVLSSGILFGFLEATGAVENAVGTFVRKLGLKRRELIVVVMTFLYGALGIVMGFESSIALIPIAALLSLAIGGDLILAAGISVAGVAVGFGLSPINIYTVGTGHKLAQLPLFSGASLRTILCLAGLSALAWYNMRYLRRIIRDKEASLGLGLDTQGLALSKSIADYRMGTKDAIVVAVLLAGVVVKVCGVFIYHWRISDVAALYCAFAFLIALLNRNGANECGEIVLHSVAKVAPGGFMVGYATSIKEVLAMGGISDSIAHYSATALGGLPLYLAAVGMMGIQSAMNFLIPSGSGQALATLPVLIPVGEVLGLTRQTTVLAFQVGDGVTNLINPALGGLMAMLSLSRVPFDRWLRYIFPLFLGIMVLSVGAVVFSVAIDYGPF